MALILSIETSATACSVALHKDAALIDSHEITEPQAHASKLAVITTDLFKGVNYDFKNLEAVAVSAGPGSYTGLRIGTSTAKGICYALNIPLISVNTLEQLAFQVRDIASGELRCPMIDAKRMEVYCQVMKDDGQILQPIEAKVIDENSFVELLNEHKMFFFGDGAEKCKNVLTHRNAGFVDNIYPRASTLGIMAFSKFLNGDFEDLTEFVPLYHKDFVAKKARSVFEN